GEFSWAKGEDMSGAGLAPRPAGSGLRSVLMCEAMVEQLARSLSGAPPGADEKPLDFVEGLSAAPGASAPELATASQATCAIESERLFFAAQRAMNGPPLKWLLEFWLVAEGDGGDGLQGGEPRPRGPERADLSGRAPDLLGGRGAPSPGPLEDRQFCRRPRRGPVFGCLRGGGSALQAHGFLFLDLFGAGGPGEIYSRVE
ncbi:unnamed protein product, partial [Prorocentrum cordatum]